MCHSFLVSAAHRSKAGIPRDGRNYRVKELLKNKDLHRPRNIFKTRMQYIFILN
jgi:hypothetical protein